MSDETIPGGATSSRSGSEAGRDDAPQTGQQGGSPHQLSENGRDRETAAAGPQPADRASADQPAEGGSEGPARKRRRRGSRGGRSRSRSGEAGPGTGSEPSESP